MCSTCCPATPGTLKQSCQRDVMSCDVTGTRTCSIMLQARKGKQTLSFYTMPEYEQWKDSTSMSGWDIKYYKGLGTSTREEAKEYFADIEEHRKTFTWASKHLDCPSCRFCLIPTGSCMHLYRSQHQECCSMYVSSALKLLPDYKIWLIT